MSKAMDAFVILGVQYYISAIQALENHMSAIEGNLLHHSIEFLLKGFLVRHQSLGELKNTSHDLIKLWNDFLTFSGQKDEDHLKDCISQLNRFEEIRFARTDGGGYEQVSINISYWGIRKFYIPQRPMEEREYLLQVAHIEELIEKIFAAGNWDIEEYFKPYLPAIRKLNFRIPFIKHEGQTNAN